MDRLATVADLVADSCGDRLSQAVPLPGHPPSRFRTPVLVGWKHGTRSKDSWGAAHIGTLTGFADGHLPDPHLRLRERGTDRRRRRVVWSGGAEAVRRGGGGQDRGVVEERVRLCFGSRCLWRKQRHLEQNGYASHQEWLADWQDARSDEFFVLGSQDETAGCQLCVATVSDDGTLTLRLRLPDCLVTQHGKYLTIRGVHFNHGHEQVLAALDNDVDYSRYRREHGEKAARASELGRAISSGSSRTGRAGGSLPPPR